MKQALKYTGYTLLSFILLILLYLGGAWALYHITVSAEPITQPEITIYLKSNGVHSDVVVPIKTEFKDWSQSILYKYTLSDDTTFNYIAFGWGDRGFYLETPTWADLKASTAFKAAFGLSSPAVHATYYKQIKMSNRCIRLVITKDQYKRLIQYIESSLQTNKAGQPQVIFTSVRYGKHDAFYEAKGSYNLFHTCNTWTNEALKASGQKACWWTPFDKGIFYQYR